MHARLEVQDTADRPPPQPGARGIGVGSIDQVEPFQCSTSGTGSSVSDGTDHPTATQPVRDVHDTPSSPASSECAGVGTAWDFQLFAAAGCVASAAATRAAHPSVPNTRKRRRPRNADEPLDGKPRGSSASRRVSSATEYGGRLRYITPRFRLAGVASPPEAPLRAPCSSRSRTSMTS